MTKKLDLPKCNNLRLSLTKDCTLEEIMWIFRNIIYDQVYYNSEDDCASLYTDEDYSRLNIEQANRLQQQLSTLCDLFLQSIDDKREFNEDYLSTYSFAGPYKYLLKEKDAQITILKETLQDIATKANNVD